MTTTNTSIAWTDVTWNVTRGCRRVSPGCEHCYAERQAYRFSSEGMPYEGLVKIGTSGPRWTGKARVALSKIYDPLRLKTPKKIFVNSMSDLFFDGFDDGVIDEVLAVMLLAPQHTFQVLTKRAERMRRYLSDPGLYDRILVRANAIRVSFPKRPNVGISNPSRFPAPWIWWGVSVENQEYASARIPQLLQTPAAVRFASYEPALGPVEWWPFLANAKREETVRACGVEPMPGLDWLIVGGESGPGARPFDLAWARSAVESCQKAGMFCFVKQLGSKPVEVTGVTGNFRTHEGKRQLEMTCRRIPLSHSKGEDMNEWPEELRVQQFPTAARSAA